MGINYRDRLICLSGKDLETGILAVDSRQCNISVCSKGSRQIKLSSCFWQQYDARNMSNVFITDFIIWLAPWGEKNEPNRTLWLATRAGKIELSCPLGTTRRVPRKKILRKPNNKSFIDQASARSRWLDFASFVFCVFNVYDGLPSTPSRSDKHAKKVGQYPAILTSRLVNNPYVSALACMEFSVTKN